MLPLDLGREGQFNGESPAYVSDSHLAPRFYRGDAKRQFHQVIETLQEAENKTVVIIVDQAHLSGKEILENEFAGALQPPPPRVYPATQFEKLPVKERER